MIQYQDIRARRFLPEDWMERRLPAITAAAEKLKNGTGAGGAFTGWVRLPQEALEGEELPRIQAAARQIQEQSNVLVVIGIGGSYLGARAVYELLQERCGSSGVELLFAGNGLSAQDVLRTVRAIGSRDFSVNVISKSGTTTEPAVAFRIFKGLLEERYGKEGARKRIYATTDREKGALRTLAGEEGYPCFVVPDAVGGRFSVLTAVGLLPLAAAGLEIDRLLRGAACEAETLWQGGADNPAWRYAAARHALYESGKRIEVLACYEPAFHYMTEWWKQLFGESEGKEGKGLFPAGVGYTADLHSMGQYVQEGERSLFETVVRFAETVDEVAVPSDPDSADGLEFLAGKPLSFVLEQAMMGTALAHEDGGVPNLRIDVPDLTENAVGALLYFFEYACGLSGYLLGVNPFDQPGVEAYKKNMFALLGKPGYEAQQRELQERLKQDA